jgi:hypothetical protein
MLHQMTHRELEGAGLDLLAQDDRDEHPATVHRLVARHDLDSVETSSA